MANIPKLDRVLILATHPDDDVIGAGGLIQHVLAGGGSVRVLFITGGESNEWPQRAVYRKWRITSRERSQWSLRRCQEARAALARIGAPDDCAFFLGYVDQQIASLARTGDRRLAEDIERHVSEFKPTLVVSPSFLDVHTDHRATAWFVHSTLGTGTPIVTYAVHGGPSASRTLFTIQLTAEQQKSKRDAIACHETQLVLSRERFLAYARATENFYASEHDLVRPVSTLDERLSAVRHSVRAVVGVFQVPALEASGDYRRTPPLYDSSTAEEADGMASSESLGRKPAFVSLQRVRQLIRRR